MKKGLIGVVVGAAAALGGGWVAKKLMGGDGYDANGATLSEPPPPGAVPHREGLDPTLLEILACPEDKQPVIYQKEGDEERLTCTKCGKRYAVRDGIPIMLIEEAQAGPVPTEAEIKAAQELAPQGKPALVGAGAPSTPAAGGPSSASAAPEASNQGQPSAG